MAFRLSYLVYELHLKKISQPKFIDYLTFSFFTPTFLMGPINPYQYYIESFSQPNRQITPLYLGFSRIVIGLTKMFVLCIFVEQLSFKAIWFDGKAHGILDFIISCLASYFFIYLNFAGYTDTAIGTSAILNIKVKENFDYPFLARNMLDLWRRWHISLSEYLRDVLFTPLTLEACRKFRAISPIHLTAITLFLTFILNGLWHGTTFNFIMIGFLNGIGVVTAHYYSAWINSRARPLKQAINNSKILHFFGVSITLFYFSFICFFFVVSYEESVKILENLRGFYLNAQM